MEPLALVELVQHGTVCFLHEGVKVYVDPYRIAQNDAAHDADVIVITHGHPDHFSPEDIDAVRQADTCFVTTEALAKRLEREFGVDECYISCVDYTAPAVCLECGVMITPVPAYNDNHPVGEGFGCVLSIGGFSYYLSGDTDVLATDVRCDVLFVCCDGIYNMHDFATRIPTLVAGMDETPKLVVPYHYGEKGMQGNGALLCEALTRAGIACREWQKEE